MAGFSLVCVAEDGDLDGSYVRAPYVNLEDDSQTSATTPLPDGVGEVGPVVIFMQPWNADYFDAKPTVSCDGSSVTVTRVSGSPRTTWAAVQILRLHSIFN